MIIKKFIGKYWLISLIIFLALFLRFYKLNTYPALNADEAAIGYNAYSLLQTGKDEHGHGWPITFQSFNDYKPGLYFYLVLPFVKYIGLNEWAVRIPGALLGTLSVVAIYLLCNKLFSDKKFVIWNLPFGNWPALMLAISPWHIHFSRGGWEVNAATTFIILGLLFFYYFLEEHNKRLSVLFISGVFFVLALYTYHAVRVTIPLLCFALVFIFRKEIFTNFKSYLITVLVCLFLLVPLGLDLMSPGTLSRAQGVGLFADKGPLNRINEQRGEHGNLNDLSAKVVHNKFVNYSLAFLNNWTKHFNGEFLFMSGDSIERNKVPETGEMYLFDILFLFFGFIVIAQTYNKHHKAYSLLLAWLFIAPVASAFTFQSPNALRSQNMVIPLVVVSALGFIELCRLINVYKQRKLLRATLCIVLGTLVFWSFGRYQEMYWKYMSKVYPYSSQYGVKELVTYLDKVDKEYKNVYVTTRYDQPYILFLFYKKYPPRLFQSSHALTPKDEFGFSTVTDFDKYHFGPIDHGLIKNNPGKSLIIGTAQEIPKDANIIKKIYGTNGFEYFDVVSK
jgi:4-amino-4-deoxy-L-arabinose transferase-like glycosyltransferase